MLVIFLDRDSGAASGSGNGGDRFGALDVKPGARSWPGVRKRTKIYSNSEIFSKRHSQTDVP